MNALTIAVDPRPRGCQILGARCWVEVDGALTWRGNLSPPAPVSVVVGDLVAITRRCRLGKAVYPPGSHGTVIMVDVVDDVPRAAVKLVKGRGYVAERSLVDLEVRHHQLVQRAFVELTTDDDESSDDDDAA